MSVCIAGSQYIPSIEYFAHWKYHGHITMEVHEHYQKRTWRNKTAILGPDAPQFLTVPLQKGKHQQMAICDVRIAYDEPWQKIHLNSLKTVYGKTAFFDEVLPGLEELYQTEFETLWEFNEAGFKIVLSLLAAELSYDQTELFCFSYPPDVADLRMGVPAGAAALPAAMIPVYPQVQRLEKTHQPNLCILDALCHLGPETGSYLDRYAYKLYKKP